MYAPRRIGIEPVRMTGGKFGPEVRLFWLATLALIVGLAVYAVDRGGDVYFWPARLTIDAQLSVFGPIGKHLPTFLHTVAFVLSTVAILWPWPRSLPAVCIAWMAIESAFELGQLQPLGERIAAALPAWIDGIPLLEAAPIYFASGTFDVLDILSIGLGAVTACLIARYLREGGLP